MKSIKNIGISLGIVWKSDHLYIIYKVLLAFIDGSINLIDVILLKFILEALEKDIKSVLYVLVAYFSFSLVFQFLYYILDERLLPISEEKVKCKIEIDLYKESELKDISLFDNSEFYNQYYFVLTNSKNNILDLVNNLINFLKQVFLSLSLIGIIMSYESIILLMITIFVLLNAIINLFRSKLLHNKYLSMTPDDRKINYINRVFYLKNYAAEIRIFKFFDVFKDMYEKTIVHKIDIIRIFSKKIIKTSFLEHLNQNVLQFVLLVYMGLKVLDKSLNIPNFIVIYNGVAELNAQLLALITTVPATYSNSLYIDDYMKFFENHAQENKFQRSPIYDIELENVSFSYNSCENILKEVCLHVCRGNPTAIIGVNGSGKTTLIKCICGMYAIKYGKIKYNNDSLNREIVKENCSVIFQDFQLYATTIANNILPEIMDKEVKEKKVIEALKKVGLYDKIKKLKKGIYTEVTYEFDAESGISFSGGESQKIAIARVIAKNKDIIILDEPTSSLDFMSEKEMFKLLNKLFKDKILIYVTHRIDVVKKVKNILLVDEGHVKDISNYSENEKTMIIKKTFSKI